MRSGLSWTMCALNHAHCAGASTSGTIVDKPNRGQETAPTKSNKAGLPDLAQPVGAPPSGAMVGKPNRGQENVPTKSTEAGLPDLAQPVGAPPYGAMVGTPRGQETAQDTLHLE